MGAGEGEACPKPASVSAADEIDAALTGWLRTAYLNAG